MLFNSFIFLFFLVFILPLVFSLKPKYRQITLTIASYFFYGYWDWRFTGLLLLSTFVDFFIGKAIYSESNQNKKKYLLYTSLLTNLGILGFFKYFNFFAESFNNTLALFNYQLDFLHLNIILPVGISFYTFQTLSYTLDIYRGELKPTESFLNFALFVSFFPQLVAGPIERAKHLLPQLDEIKRPSKQYIREGIALISIGMFKKIIIGDTLGRIVDPIFTEPSHYGSIELIASLILFSLQIYNDFSGYSHIARGTSRLLGIDLMENFNQPYLSTNITEFWRRWHISLSTWLRDYLYIPLGGNRRGNRRTYINLMLTMLLGGLWHGANWTFVVWGGLHGVFLAIHKLMIGNKKLNFENNFRREKGSISLFIIKLIFTNLLVLLTWLFFRADSFSTAFYYLTKMFAFVDSSFPLRFVLITAMFGFLSTIIDFMEYSRKSHTFWLQLTPSIRYAFYTIMWFYSLLYMFQAEPMPFIYFQF